MQRQLEEQLLALLKEKAMQTTMLEKRAQLNKRVADLRRLQLERAETLRLKRQEIERQRAETQARRSLHDAAACSLADYRRVLETKRLRLTRSEYLRDPLKHKSNLGTFHIYKELSEAIERLTAERRRRCAERVSLFPFKWIESGGQEKGYQEPTVTLGQVQSFTPAGVFGDDGRVQDRISQTTSHRSSDAAKDLQAAVSFLVLLMQGLAGDLDMTLPFQCELRNPASPAKQPFALGAGARRASLPGAPGYDPSSAAVAAADHARENSPPHVGIALMQALPTHLCSPRATAAASESSNPEESCMPGIAHPFSGRWHEFRIRDHTCTSEYARALRLVNENVVLLCACQGSKAPPRFGTLELLTHCLSSANLGCLWPPAAVILHAAEDDLTVIDTYIPAPPKKSRPSSPAASSVSKSTSAQSSARKIGEEIWQFGQRTFGDSCASRSASPSAGGSASQAFQAIAIAARRLSGASPEASPTRAEAAHVTCESEDGEWMLVEHC